MKSDLTNFLDLLFFINDFLLILHHSVLFFKSHEFTLLLNFHEMLNQMLDLIVINLSLILFFFINLINVSLGCFNVIIKHSGFSDKFFSHLHQVNHAIVSLILIF